MALRPSSIALVGFAIVLSVGVALIRHRREATAPILRVSGSQPGSSAKYADAIVSIDQMEVADLERRVAAIERGGNANDPSSTDAANSGRSPKVRSLPRRTPEERARRIEEDFEYHQNLLAQNSAAPRDPEWAPAMERAVTERFEKIQNGAQYKYGGVDCRTNTCAVTVEWPSRQAAELDLREAVDTLATTRCKREVALPPPDNNGGKTEAKIVMQCGIPPTSHASN
jgi:hypothetical protein